MLRILIADDHETIRRGLRDILERHEGWQVCAEAPNGRLAVELAQKTRPDVAVLDLAMPELNGLEATRHIKTALPRTEVLIFTMHEMEEQVAPPSGSTTAVHRGRRLTLARSISSVARPSSTAFIMNMPK